MGGGGPRPAAPTAGPLRGLGIPRCPPAPPAVDGGPPRCLGCMLWCSTGGKLPPSKRREAGLPLGDRRGTGGLLLLAALLMLLFVE